tara:strand:- start:47 stop:1021 length:975 start_codon:yes stop_codon:yes gene_type:complete
MSKKKDRVLVIDALNMYYRAYIVDPSLSTNGQPIGGMKGFMKIMQKLIRETSPDSVVIAWDGPGGSRKKKTMNKAYKEGRKPLRLNRGIQGLLTENEELKNKVWQQTRLIEYLNQLPISQIMLPEIEADDVIAYVTKMSSLAGKEKVIVSSDKDFIQLCNDETVLYRPIQKEVLNVHSVVEKFGIHPANFALSRAIAGDKSDNLAGISGAGLKSIAKRFPFLAEDMEFELIDILEACENTENKLKIHENILDNEGLIQENYKIMQLYYPNISPQAKAVIDNSINNLDCSFNKTEFIKMGNEDGLGVFDWSTLYQTCQHIIFKNC